ncbi:hypothetical protein GCK32_019402 [Trichostrongylus colubriformis]|uniref:Sushi domain-containing protein n=1 Tax=Trichostrongylus colubriformis TaxID=6319 RepID=A0AAN8FAC3_TRICO
MYTPALHRNDYIISMIAIQCVDHREEANGIECVNGEWISNLLPCLSNNATVYSGKSLFDDGMCILPPLDKTMRIVNIDNYVPQDHHKFAHGTSLMVGCTIGGKMGDHMELKCRRGKWSKRNRINCDIREIYNFFFTYEVALVCAERMDFGGPTAKIHHDFLTE